MDDELKLSDNRMYIIMEPTGEYNFNIVCVDKLQEPINELYYMLRGLCEMSIKHQEDLIDIGKEVMLQEKLKTTKLMLMTSTPT